MDTRGIDYWVVVGKFRVRIHRNGITHKVGLYDTLDEALEAKKNFLDDYALRSEDTDAVPQYSKEWFNREHRKQVEKFKQLYSTPTKDMPHFIVITDNQEPHYMLSTVDLRLRQQSQNDGYENDFER